MRGARFNRRCGTAAVAVLLVALVRAAAADEFNVFFATTEPLGIRLAADLSVTGFHRAEPGNKRMPGEATGWIHVGDTLVSVNEQAVSGRPVSAVASLIAGATPPKILRFRARAGENRTAAMAAAGDDGDGPVGIHGHAGVVEVSREGVPVASARFLQAMFGGQLHCRGGRFVAADPPAGCQAYRHSVANAVVLVHRGGCTFADKAVLAEAAGALALVVINSRDGGDVLRMPAARGDGSENVVIPVVMVASSDGEELGAAARGGGAVARVVRRGLKCGGGGAAATATPAAGGGGAPRGLGAEPTTAAASDFGDPAAAGGELVALAVFEATATPAGGGAGSAGGGAADAVPAAASATATPAAPRRRPSAAPTAGFYVSPTPRRRRGVDGDALPPPASAAASDVDAASPPTLARRSPPVPLNSRRAIAADGDAYDDEEELQAEEAARSDAALAAAAAGIAAAATAAPPPPAPTLPPPTAAERWEASRLAADWRGEFVRAAFGARQLPAAVSAVAGDGLRLVAANPADACGGTLQPPEAGAGGSSGGGGYAGTAVLVARGGCAFDAKARAVAAAGGAMLVVVNDAAAIAVMQGGAVGHRGAAAAAADSEDNVTAVMVTHATGTQLRRLLTDCDADAGGGVDGAGGATLTGPGTDAAARPPRRRCVGVRIRAAGDAAVADYWAELARLQADPGTAWPGAPAQRRKQYMLLARRHHPDRPTGCAERFDALVAAHAAAEAWHAAHAAPEATPHAGGGAVGLGAGAGGGGSDGEL